MRTVEPRVLAGIAVMVLATIVGALAMQHAQQRTAVWAVARSLAAGTRLSAGDLHVAQVAIDSGASPYAAVGRNVVGAVLRRDVSAYELLPVDALRRADGQTRRVTIPVEPLHLPPSLRRGQLVDVWITPSDRDGSVGITRLVLPRILVESAGRADVSGKPSVVVDVPPSRVSLLVAALRLGAVDLVGVGGGA